ncbi:hypothetical protein CRG98_023197 [Punica granatum]|uniref:Uncharacterized protein n=1 Tax=Punica granatum TaxID=22663 RepID=A0A2I0JJE4_PUNGR|nr:hypothetical protein CRG98_023197 [Punica granatum]
MSRCRQEAEQGVPYQDDRKICVGLVNVNDILISGKRRKAVNKQASKQTGLSPNPLEVPSRVAKLCAPEFNLVRARMRDAYVTRLGSVHLPGNTCEKESPLTVYDPYVKGR